MTDRQLTATSYDRQYYDEHTAAGLDYAAYGDWQRHYGRWLVEVFNLRGKRVLDVGCACGAQLRGLIEAGAIGEGIDVSEYMVEVGRQRNPQSTLHVGPCWDLSRWPDGYFDLVHTHNSAEHWPEDRMLETFAEFRRVCAQGGHLFAVIDTAETMNLCGNGDPTHITVQPIPWWRGVMSDAGWDVGNPGSQATRVDRLTDALRSHPLSYLATYAWSWFVAGNPESPD